MTIRPGRWIELNLCDFAVIQAMRLHVITRVIQMNGYTIIKQGLRISETEFVGQWIVSKSGLLSRCIWNTD
jgi:hypothetical protein